MPILCLLGFGTASVFAFVIMFLRSKINKTHKCCPFSQYLPAIVIPYIMHGDAISEARCGSPLRQRSITVVVHTEIYVPRSFYIYNPQSSKCVVHLFTALAHVK